MKLALIAALTDRGVIGADNRLPWKLGEDLKSFKRLTLGHPVIMGRKTWDSLPRRPLPERPNVVLSRSPGFEAPGAVVCATLKQAVGELAPSHKLAFVIGGAGLFAEALPLAERLHLTFIHHDFAGDVFFPAWDRALWRETAREKGTSPEGWDYEFADFEKT